MNQYNNSANVKVRNIDVGKSDCSVVLVPQGDRDNVILNRLMNEDVVLEPVTLTDDLRELDGHEHTLRKGYARGLRVAVRPKPAAEKVARVAKPAEEEPAEEEIVEAPAKNKTTKKKATKKVVASDKD